MHNKMARNHAQTSYISRTFFHFNSALPRPDRWCGRIGTRELITSRSGPTRVDEIVALYPHLNHAETYAALAYDDDH